MSLTTMLILRPATLGDVPSLVAIAKRSWLSAFADALPSTAVRAWAEADRASDWYRAHWPSMTVAEQNGVILGLVQPAGDEVNGLWVDPVFQGQGVGSSLLAAAERQIALAGHTRAWLRCSGRNNRAQAFYRSRGYQLTRTERSVLPDGSPENLLVYEKVLSPTRLEA